jgi:hypothetical protein
MVNKASAAAFRKDAAKPPVGREHRYSARSCHTMAARTARPESPHEWTPEEVVGFLTDPKAAGLPQSAAAAFSANQIDGAALLELTTEEVRSELGLVLGHRKTLFRAINDLKAARKAAKTKAKRAGKQGAPSSPPPGTAVSQPPAAAKKSEARVDDSPPSPAASAPAAAGAATPRKDEASDITTAAAAAAAAVPPGLACGGCGCGDLAPEKFSARQRKIAQHTAARSLPPRARCIACVQGTAAAASPRSAATALQPYLARSLRPAEAAGYKASGVLPMRRAHDGTLEVLLALERRQDWAIRARGDKAAKKAKADQADEHDSANLLAASGRVQGDYLHPIGGTREADDADSVTTAAREFGEEVGHVLASQTKDSEGAALTQAMAEAVKGARGRYVLWQPRGKYALWLYLLPAEHADVAETFAAWKSKAVSSATTEDREQNMLGVRWVPVSADGTVQIGQHAKLEEASDVASTGCMATSFCTELLQRKALRQQLAQTARRHLRLQLSADIASPVAGSGTATPSPVAQSPMLAVAAEALLSKRLSAPTPSPTKKQRKGKDKVKRKIAATKSGGDEPSEPDAKRAKAVTDGEVKKSPAAAADTAAADEIAAKKEAKKEARKKRKQMKKAKKKAEKAEKAQQQEGSNPGEDAVADVAVASKDDGKKSGAASVEHAEEVTMEVETDKPEEAVAEQPASHKRKNAEAEAGTGAAEEQRSDVKQQEPVSEPTGGASEGAEPPTDAADAGVPLTKRAKTETAEAAPEAAPEAAAPEAAPKPEVTAGAKKSEAKSEEAVAAPEDDASASDNNGSDELFVEDRKGTTGEEAAPAGEQEEKKKGKSQEEKEVTPDVQGSDTAGAGDAAAPKPLNRAERKKQRQLAHAARQAKQAASASASAAAAAGAGAGAKKELTLLSSTEEGGADNTGAAAAATTAPPLPSPRSLGKFRFTGRGLQID